MQCSAVDGERRGPNDGSAGAAVVQSSAIAFEPECDPLTAHSRLQHVFGQKAGADYGPQAVALGSVIAAMIVVPVGIAKAGAALLTAAALPYGLAIALLSTALPYTLEMIALTRLPARTFGILMSIEPAFGTLFGWAILHEVLTRLQCTAIAMIILASIGTTWTATVRRTSPVPMPE